MNSIELLNEILEKSNGGFELLKEEHQWTIAIKNNGFNLMFSRIQKPDEVSEEYFAAEVLQVMLMSYLETSIKYHKLKLNAQKLKDSISFVMDNKLGISI